MVQPVGGFLDFLTAASRTWSDPETVGGPESAESVLLQSGGVVICYYMLVMCLLHVATYVSAQHVA